MNTQKKIVITFLTILFSLFTFFKFFDFHGLILAVLALLDAAPGEGIRMMMAPPGGEGGSGAGSSQLPDLLPPSGKDEAGP